jgi:hypothetical protein
MVSFNWGYLLSITLDIYLLLMYRWLRETIIAVDLTININTYLLIVVQNRQLNLNRYSTFNMWMWIVAFEFKIFEFKVKNVFNFWI